MFCPLLVGLSPTAGAARLSAIDSIGIIDSVDIIVGEKEREAVVAVTIGFDYGFDGFDGFDDGLFEFGVTVDLINREKKKLMNEKGPERQKG